MKIQEIKLSAMNPAQYNPRTHTPEFLDRLEKSMERFECVELIVWNENTKNIVGGHARYKVLMRQNKIKTDTVIVNLSIEEEKSLNLALNRITGDWDNDLLAGLITEIQGFDTELDINLDDIGFTDIEISELLGSVEPPIVIEEDDFEMPEEPSNERNIKRGDIFALGEHRLMCGDATSEDDMKKLMDGKKGHLIVTDPPYSVDYQGKAKDLNKRMNTKINEGNITFDNLGLEECKKIWSAAFKNYHDYSEDTASYYCTAPQGGDHMMMMMMMMIQENWQVKHELIWVKDSMVLGRADYHYQHEPIIYGWKKGKTHNFYGDRTQKSIWEIPRPRASLEHPTMKPVELYTNAIQNSSKPGDTIVDFFAGSGVLAIACEQLNRTAYLCEIDPHYCNVIIDRWEAFAEQKAKKLN